jgi:hypothetical protein
MKRTTVSLDEGLLRQIKRIAAAEGRTLQAVTNDLLRKALAAPPARPYAFEVRGWEATEQPGVDILDRDKLFDVMDGR